MIFIRALKLIMYLFITSLEHEFCVQIVTGSERTGNDGTLELSINNLNIQSRMYRLGEKVLDACFPTLDFISVRNPTNDAWTGEISVTRNGRQKRLVCTNNCSGGSFVRKIVVDGNEDGTTQASTWCLNGNTCFLALEGTQNIIKLSA